MWPQGLGQILTPGAWTEQNWQRSYLAMLYMGFPKHMPFSSWQDAIETEILYKVQFFNTSVKFGWNWPGGIRIRYL